MTGTTSLLSGRFVGLSGLGTFAPVRDKRTDGGDRLIDLASGIPDPNVLPYDRIASAVHDVLHGHEAFPALSYSDFTGVRALREHIARLRGVDVENVFVTNGAMQGIFLSAAALVNPGDRVLVEDPAFPEAVRIFRLAGAVVEPLGFNGGSLDLDELEKRCRFGSSYKAIYTVPDFQNPSGRVMSAGDKSRLISLAEEYGFAVVADDPYRSLWFEDPPSEFPQEVREARVGERLWEIGSFSKILGPGWRIGWVIASRESVRVLTSFRRSVDGHPSTLGQYAIARLLDDHRWFADLLAGERKVYSRRAHVLRQALVDAFGDAVEIPDVRGGYFAWPSFPGVDLSDSEDRRVLESSGVRVVGGGAFRVDGGRRSAVHEIRLCFAHAPVNDLCEGVARLAKAFPGGHRDRGTPRLTL